MKNNHIRRASEILSSGVWLAVRKRSGAVE